MIVKQVKLQKFRGYNQEVTIDFNNLTVFVGKNDVGKSTILEALDIFFNENKGVVKIDKNDINKKAEKEGNNEIKITVVFGDLPETLIIDSNNPTNLNDEYLLNKDGNLEIVKKYVNGGKEKVFIKAKHPTNKKCENLLSKKINELKNIVESNNIECKDKGKSSELRKAIWNYYKDNLELQEIEIDITKEDAKNIWEQLKKYMPLYALFQSDRKNSDGDNEIQNPMKLAVKEILRDNEIIETLNDVANKVKKQLEDISNNTLKKIKEMNPEIADSLNPVIPTTESLKWAEVFKNVSITGDEDIPINKRGSGVKRLVLLNFFRAEAERRIKEAKVENIIYAIEEPETSQHYDHQKKLIEAFIELSNTENTQIILTTHSSEIVKMLDFQHLRLIKKDGDIKIENIEKKELPYPSLNEVNFLAFDLATEEYHNELYGYIEYKDLLKKYKDDRIIMLYKREYKQKNGEKVIKEEQKILSEYIRHQIHHPENTLNTRFTSEQLRESIKEMRSFIKSLKNNDE